MAPQLSGPRSVYGPPGAAAVATATQLEPYRLSPAGGHDPARPCRERRAGANVQHERIGRGDGQRREGQCRDAPHIRHDAAMPESWVELGLMRGAPPPPERLVTSDNWIEGPFNRWGFLHVRELAHTARISRGDGPVRELPRAD